MIRDSVCYVSPSYAFDNTTRSRKVVFVKASQPGPSERLNGLLEVGTCQGQLKRCITDTLSQRRLMVMIDVITRGSVLQRAFNHSLSGSL